MLQKLYFITGNAKKAVEAQDILEFPIEVKKLEIEEIQSFDIEEVAWYKAQEAFKILRKPLIIDDAGFFVDAWNGFPGPFIKFLLKSGGSNLLLRMLEQEKERGVYSRAVVAFHDGKEIHTFLGEVKGIVSPEIRGDGAKEDWDPIFIPEGQKLTYAQMGFKEKNKISHRRRALEKLKTFLNENNYIKD